MRVFREKEREGGRAGGRAGGREGEERGINYKMCNILQFVPNLFTTICTKSIHYSLYKIYSPRCIHDDELPVVPCLILCGTMSNTLWYTMSNTLWYHV